MRRRGLAFIAGAVVTAVVAAPASGSSVVYECGANLCRVDPAKPRAVERLTRDGTRARPYEGPRLSRDGRRLLFKRGDELVLAAATAKRRRVLLRDSQLTLWYLRPDGGGIAYTRNRESLNPITGQLELRNLLYQQPFDGRGPRGNVTGGSVVSAGWLGRDRVFRQLTPADHPYDILCLTPVTPEDLNDPNVDCRGTIAQDPNRHLSQGDGSWDGRFVVAVAEQSEPERDFEGAIALYDARTSAHVRDLTSGSGDAAPQFSPDGKHVLFVRGRALYTVSLKPGSKPRRLVSGGAGAWGVR